MIALGYKFKFWSLLAIIRQLDLRKFIWIGHKCAWLDGGIADMGRIMGLDYGSVTVGVAISDSLLITAQGIEIIRRKQENVIRKTLVRIEELIKEYQVDTIVVGYPKHMNNTVGERAKKAEEFANTLRKRTGLEVILWDERLTTVAADRVLSQTSMNYKEKAFVVDKLAAVLILQGYLDMLNFKKDGSHINEQIEE